MKVSICLVVVSVVSMLTFSGCAQDTGAVTSKASSASTGTSLTTPASTITGGNPNTTNAAYTRGSLYGSCLRQLNSQFVAGSTDGSATYPIQNCTQTAEPSCAAGFQIVTDSIIQMNCSTTPSPTSNVACYWKSQKCAKLAGTDAAEVYSTGQTYGMCLRKLDGSFQPTYADPFVYPVTSCASTGTPTCAAGFKLVSDAPVQMNCAANPSASFEPCYFQTQRCMKL